MIDISPAQPEILQRRIIQTHQVLPLLMQLVPAQRLADNRPHVSARRIWHRVAFLLAPQLAASARTNGDSFGTTDALTTRPLANT